jgi:hypothetical protein
MGTIRIARLGRFFRPRSSWLSPLSVQCLPTTGFPAGRVEGILRQPILVDRVLEDVVQDPAATAEIVRCGQGAVDLARQRVEDQALGLVIL